MKEEKRCTSSWYNRHIVSHFSKNYQTTTQPKYQHKPMYFLQVGFLMTIGDTSVLTSGVIMKLKPEFYFILLQESFSICSSRREAISWTLLFSLWHGNNHSQCLACAHPLNLPITTSWKCLPPMGTLVTFWFFSSAKSWSLIWLQMTWIRQFPKIS